MDKLKVLLRRFARGFLGGAIASAITVGLFAGQNIQELGQWLFFLGLAGVSGGITGGLLALDKAVRWTNEK